MEVLNPFERILNSPWEAGDSVDRDFIEVLRRTDLQDERALALTRVWTFFDVPRKWYINFDSIYSLYYTNSVPHYKEGSLLTREMRQFLVACIRKIISVDDQRKEILSFAVGEVVLPPIPPRPIIWDDIF